MYELQGILSMMTVFIIGAVALGLFGLGCAIWGRIQAGAFHVRAIYAARLAMVEAGGLPRYRKATETVEVDDGIPIHVDHAAFEAHRRERRPTQPVLPLSMQQIVAGVPDVPRPAAILRDDRAVALQEKSQELRRSATAQLLNSEPEKGLLMSQLADLAAAFAQKVEAEAVSQPSEG